MNLFRSLPKHVNVAFSGGIDSSVLLHKLVTSGKEVTLCVFDHENDYAATEVAFAKVVSSHYNIDLKVDGLTKSKSSKESLEEYWSRERNNWFRSLNGEVAVGHNLNDAVEWYLITALAGTGGFILDYKSANVIRPLITTSRSEIEEYAVQNSIHYLTDPTNNDPNFSLRNNIRHSLMPEAIKVNPGLLNTIKRRIIKKCQDM